jgi:hypothetical protein
MKKNMLLLSLGVGHASSIREIYEVNIGDNDNALFIFEEKSPQKNFE